MVPAHGLRSGNLTEKGRMEHWIGLQSFGTQVPAEGESLQQT